MIQPQWHVLKLYPGERNVDSRNEEFFTVDADGLIREALQNSLDAWAKTTNQPGKACRVEITIAKARDPDGARSYLEGLRRHVEHARVIGYWAPDQDPSVPFLAIEDFGTPGLRGDTEVVDPEDPRTDANDFFFFWRNEGRSAKTAQQMGRFGLGKTVFASSSQVRAFFGVSVTDEGGSPTLMGSALLKTHSLDGVRYRNYADYGLATDNEPCKPVTDRDSVRRLCDAFGLRRGRDPGLSVVIPYRRKEIDQNAVVSAVLRHFGYAVFAGALEVCVTWPEGRLPIDQSTIADMPEKAKAAGLELRENDFIGVRDMQFVAYATTEAEFVTIKDAAEQAAPRWDDLLFGDELPRLREQYDRGDPVAIRVPLTMRLSDGMTIPTEFRVFVKRRNGDEETVEHYVRRYLSLPVMRDRSRVPANALLLVPEGELCSFLGDCEDPGHTRWELRSDDVRRKYKHAESTVRFVRQALNRVVNALSMPAVGRDSTLLSHLFPKPTSSDATKRAPEPRAPEVFPESKPKRLVVAPVAGGFVVRNAGHGIPPGSTLAIMAAYDRRHGDPFKHYRSLDFTLNRPPIHVSGMGARKQETHNNVVRFRIDAPEFEIRITGFDFHRDVITRTELEEPRT